MATFVAPLRENPELALFLTLAVGFLIGRLRLGTFRLGNVVGTLLAGVRGRPDWRDDSPLVKVVFFDLFLFATGYKVGPQFFRGLGAAQSQLLLTVVLCVTSLVDHRRGRKRHGLRLRHGRGSDGGRVHGVDDDRHGGRRHRAPRATGR